MSSRTWKTMLLGMTLVACSSSSPTSPTPASTPEGQTSPPADEAVPGSDEDPGAPAAETFDLVLRGVAYDDYLALMGETSNEVQVAVQDGATKKRAAWTAKTVTSGDATVELTWPKLLARDASYDVAVAAYGRYALHAVGPVTGAVVLEIDQEKTRVASDSTSDEAYDVLNTKLTLAPGTYEAAFPADGTSITLVVGPSGRLASRSISLGCRGAGACGSVSVWSNPTCGPSFVRGDDLTSHIDVARNAEKLDATVSIDGAAFRVKGTMKSGTCCSVPVDVLVPRKSADTDACK